MQTAVFPSLLPFFPLDLFSRAAISSINAGAISHRDFTVNAPAEIIDTRGCDAFPRPLSCGPLLTVFWLRVAPPNADRRLGDFPEPRDEFPAPGKPHAAGITGWNNAGIVSFEGFCRMRCGIDVN